MSFGHRLVPVPPNTVTLVPFGQLTRDDSCQLMPYFPLAEKSPSDGDRWAFDLRLDGLGGVESMDVRVVIPLTLNYQLLDCYIIIDGHRLEASNMPIISKNVFL